MNNQKQLWDKLHKKGKVDSNKPTNFAKEVQSIFPPKSKILDLGCGVGNDSIYFARLGHQILATDFSEIAIRKDKEHFKDNNLKFEVLDMSKSMNFPDNTFDVIYARLSLHYFTDKVTKMIFKELHRILKLNGLLMFLCKSMKDPLYGKGEQIEKDMFEEEGHIRHFFSEDYVKECLGTNFKIKRLETGRENFYGDPSAFVKVIASKLQRNIITSR